MLGTARLLAALLFGTLILSAPTRADEFTVANGQTLYATLELPHSGDSGIIEAGGAISTSGSYHDGVLSDSDHNTVNNYGSISTDGDFADGIYSGQDYFTANNAGSITGSGYEATGINSSGYATGQGNYASLTNSGSIYETGSSTEGISSYGSYATIVNSGTITTLDDESDNTDLTAGILTSADHPVVTNTGTINTTGYQSFGVFAWSDDATVTNSGTINASAAYSSAGIYSLDAADSTVVNTGAIYASGEYAKGIWHTGGGDNFTVINSGKIITIGDYTYAIDIHGEYATMTLLPGTALQGGLYLDTPGSATINIGTGLNTALTFDSPDDLPATTNTDGQPYIRDTTTGMLAVVDPTGLAAANDFGFDLSRAILDTVEARMGSPNGDGLTTGALPGSGATVHRDFWTAGLGLYGDHTAQGSLDGYHYGAGGMMAGADRALSADSTAGLFGGVAAGSISTDAGSTNINAVGAFAGGYFSHDDGKAFTHVSLVGGGLDNSSDRTVANNLVSGGLETARADYGSFYASPALTLGLHEHMGDAIVSPSLGLRYAGIYRGGYTETGSAADVTADSGTGQALDVRGAVRTDFAAKVSDAGVRRFNVTAGVDGIFTWGGAVDGTLLGTDITLLASGQQSVARGFLGAGTTFDAADGTHFSADFNASYDTADTFGLSAQAGMNRTF